jgi:hypothetical protein
MIVLSNGEYFDIGGSAFCLETGVSVVRVNVRFVEKVRSQHRVDPTSDKWIRLLLPRLKTRNWPVRAKLE